MIDLMVGGALLLGGIAFGVWIGTRALRRPLARLKSAVIEDSWEPLPSTRWKPADELAAVLARRHESVRQEDLRRESEQTTLRRVLNGVPDPVLLVGDGGDIQFANEAAWAMLGGSLDRDGKLLHHRLLEVVRTATDETGTQLMERFDRHRTYQATTVRETDGAVLVVLRDVTDEQRVSEMRRDFVADASHELKTPVAVIQASSETVLAALEDEDLAASLQFAGQVAESSVRLSRIVADLLDLSRLETTEGSKDPVELGSLLAEVVEQAEGLPQPVLVAPNNPVLVLGSEPDLRLAFSNLISNAVRHTPEHGSVGVRLFAGSDHIEIQVADTGEGIPSKHIARIFERFYRVDSARSRATGGTGLGLSIVRHVVSQHAGTVKVDSDFGDGTTFTISLPVPPEGLVPTSTPRSEYSREPRDDQA